MSVSRTTVRSSRADSLPGRPDMDVGKMPPSFGNCFGRAEPEPRPEPRFYDNPVPGLHNIFGNEQPARDSPRFLKPQPWERIFGHDPVKPIDPNFKGVETWNNVFGTAAGEPRSPPFRNSEVKSRQNTALRVFGDPNGPPADAHLSPPRVAEPVPGATPRRRCDLSKPSKDILWTVPPEPQIQRVGRRFRPECGSQTCREYAQQLDVRDITHPETTRSNRHCDPLRPQYSWMALQGVPNDKESWSRPREPFKPRGTEFQLKTQDIPGASPSKIAALRSLEFCLKTDDIEGCITHRRSPSTKLAQHVSAGPQPVSIQAVDLSKCPPPQGLNGARTMRRMYRVKQEL
eukprot:CAMPEP_0114544956 /NCGR_PEP_ID=MMETSP0114-20121206/3147_1 /TAXON_ID=31324 /ORGANISM="Goniomonas sp, Strain m" /LENGTH=344 /DNA_ID=CAMNT_0001729359 /DNA_START=18 /DNA_END=1052 /DNA_ORIENTATION=+